MTAVLSKKKKAYYLRLLARRIQDSRRIIENGLTETDVEQLLEIADDLEYSLTWIGKGE